MSKRAQFMVMVAGTNITSTLAPVLISLTVSDMVGTHSDTATLEVDDTGGRIVLPQIGAPVIVALGWEGEGLRTVFTGTVDEMRELVDLGLFIGAFTWVACTADRVPLKQWCSRDRSRACLLGS